MVNTVLIIEGKPGQLRQGFISLFEKKLKGKMPKIIMGSNNTDTIDELSRKSQEPKKRFALIDLDAPKEKKQNRIIELKIPEKHQKSVYFMIQEMEAWFLSQPEILDAYFRMDISKKIPKKNPEDIEKPSQKLSEYTDKKYHKVNDAIKLLELLDVNKLEKSFSDFSLLIKALIEDY